MGQIKRFAGPFSIIVSLLLVAFGASSSSFVGTSGDDLGISMMLSGAYPDSDICLFVNALLSYCVSSINNQFQSWNVFYIYLLFIAVISYSMMLFCCLRFSETTLDLLWKSCFFAICVSLSLPMCTFTPNFTMVAAVSTIGGSISFVCFFGEGGKLASRKSSWVLPVVGCVLLLNGFMIRSQAFLLCLPFLLFGLIFKLEKNKTAYTLHGILRNKALPLGVAFLFVAGLAVYDMIAWSEEENQDWLQYNRARSAFMDYPRPAYNEISDELEKIGVSENDYWLLNDAICNETSFFSTQKLNEINAILNERDQRSALSKTLDGIAQFGFSLLQLYPFLAFCIILSFSIVLYKLNIKKSMILCVIALLFMSIIISGYFSGVGRIPERVLYPIWIGYFSVLAFCVSLESKKKRCEYALNAIGCVFVSVVLLYSLFPLLQTFNSRQLLGLFDEAYILSSNERDIGQYLDEEDVYLFWDTHSFNILMSGYQSKYLPPRVVLERNVLLGGWFTNSPQYKGFALMADSSFDPDSYIKALAVDPEHMKFASFREEIAPRIACFIEEHYYPNDQVSLSIDESLYDSKLKTNIPIYRISINE